MAALLAVGLGWGVVNAVARDEAAAGAGMRGGKERRMGGEPSSRTTRHRNHLAGETSPYLLLHAENPVDWYPWGEEALSRARREDRPIFLSVGYSTCYWCHVMERESFTDPAIADFLNRHFVSIKVDREERPDLDEIYMTATQILTGHGGWPNSVFLTPDLKPFYAGTYFPPVDRAGRPGFVSVLQGLADAWEKRQPEVEAQAAEVAAAMGRYLEGRGTSGAKEPPPASVVEDSFRALAARYDATWGGFGGAPKFPTPSNLLFLEELAPERSDAAEMLRATLDRMARGGIFDQLGGGFHRYATDREWKVPHFEKMLYDNGLLLEVYAREGARTGDPELAEVARRTAGFLTREMTAPEGGFYSAIDAETSGIEGAYYAWTKAELEQVLGAEDAAFLGPLLGFSGPPFFEEGHYVLHLPVPLGEVAKQRRMHRQELLGEVERLEAKLLAARSHRERPATDDKILADWNGTAVAGMAEAGEALGEPELVARAAKAARFVLTHMRSEDGKLLHAYRAGQAKIPAYLSDYAFLVRGLLALHRVSGEPEWLKAAVALTDEQIRRLSDPRGGFFVAEERRDLLFRSKDPFDGALPAANGVVALNLLDLARMTGKGTYRREARRLLAAFAPLVERHPDALRTMALATRRWAGTGGGGPPAVTAEEPLEAEARRVVQPVLTVGGLAADGYRPVRLRLEIADGWHLNAHPASRKYLVATRLEAHGGQLRDVRYPPAERLETGAVDGAVDVYRGRVEISAGLRGSGAVRLTYQACDESRCLPPVTRELPID